jgi:hypothetical protein
MCMETRARWHWHFRISLCRRFQSFVQQVWVLPSWRIVSERRVWTSNSLHVSSVLPGLFQINECIRQYLSIDLINQCIRSPSRLSPRIHKHLNNLHYTNYSALSWTHRQLRVNLPACNNSCEVSGDSQMRAQICVVQLLSQLQRCAVQSVRAKFDVAYDLVSPFMSYFRNRFSLLADVAR